MEHHLSVSPETIENMVSFLVKFGQGNENNKEGVSSTKADLIMKHIDSSLLCPDEGGVNSDFISELIRVGATEALIGVLEQPGQSFRFYDRAVATLSLVARSSSEEAVKCLDGRVVQLFINILNRFPENDILRISFTFLVCHVLVGLPAEKRKDLVNDPDVLELIVSGAEKAVKKKDSNPMHFVFACFAIRYSADCRADIESTLFQRMIQSVYDGVVVFPDDEECQDIGRYVLNLLLGPEDAKAMIDHAEMHHCQDAECSGAA